MATRIDRRPTADIRRRIGITATEYDLLRRSPLFAGLDDVDIDDLLADSWLRHCPRGGVLFLQDDPASCFYFIFEGWIKLFRNTESGGESIIGVFTRGESFAEAAIFDEGNYPVSSMAVDDSRVLVVPANSFIRRLQENGRYALKVMASMSRHQRQLVRQVEQLTVRSSTERVVDFLLKLCPSEAADVVVRLPLDKALIAGRLGMQPETLSRSLARLRSLGVTTKGADVRIANVSVLRTWSEGSALGHGRSLEQSCAAFSAPRERLREPNR